MSETSNAARVKAAYEQWQDSRGHNHELFVALMDEGIELRSILNPPEFNAMAEDHDGLDRVRDYFAAIHAEWEMIDFPCEKVVEDGDTVVWIGNCTWKNKHTQVVVPTPKVDIWTFRDGKAVRFFEMFDTLGFARGMGIMLARSPGA